MNRTKIISHRSRRRHMHRRPTRHPRTKFFSLPLLYNLLFKIMILFSFSKIHSTLISIFITSIMFSTFHYIGSMADYFTINTFIIRFVGGVFLCLIYIKRGLGITSMTHYSYDVLLLTLPII